MSLLKSNDILTRLLEGYYNDDLRPIDIAFGVLIRDLQVRVAALERKGMIHDDTAV